MKQLFINKSIIFTLVLVLVASLLIVFICNIPTVHALPIDQQESLTENVDSMKYGYNVTAGKSLLHDGLCKNEAILKPINEGLYQYIEKFENVSQQVASSFSKSTTLDIAQEYGLHINGGLDGSLGRINSVALDIEAEFGIEKNRNEVVDELFEVYYQRQPRVQYIIQDNVDLREYISDNLVNDFKAINDVNDAQFVLNKYGTHLFTGFTYGGLMQVCNYQSTKKIEEKLSTSLSLNQKMQARISAFSGNEQFSFEEQFANAERVGSRVSKYKSTLYGGDGVTGATVDHLFSYVSGPLGEQGGFVYEKWVKSINEGKRLAIIDIPAAARAIPLWELLPAKPGFAAKRNILIEAYALMCGDKYNEYCAKYPLVNRQLASVPAGENSGKINGYTLTNKGITSFIETKNTAESVVSKDSLINVNYTLNTIQQEGIKWKVVNESVANIVDIIDDKKGVFKIKDNIANNTTFTLQLEENGKMIPNMFLDFKVVNYAFSGGDGSENNPYVISTLADLQELSNDSNYWSKNFVLANDIDCQDANINGFGNYDSNVGFSGCFDGNYCIIKNFNMVSSRGKAAGLFAYVEPTGVIDNLTLNNVKVWFENEQVENAGILTGVNKGQLRNCKLENTTLKIKRIITTIDTNDYVELNIGAFAGKMEGGGKISLCSLLGTNASNDGENKILGFVSDTNATKKGIVNAGAFVGKSTSTCGKNEKVISNSYVNNISQVRGQIIANEAILNIGGFIGQIDKAITLENVLIGKISDISVAYKSKQPAVKRVFNAVANQGTEKYTCKNCFVETNATVEKSQEGWKEKDKIDGRIIGSDLSDAAWKSIGESVFPILVQQTFDPDNALIVSPNKTEYYVGEKFDISGIKVLGKQQFSDNSFNINYFRIDASNYNEAQKGGYKIIVKALGFETVFNVQVRDVKVIGLEIVPNEKKYYYQEPISKDDYTISYVLEDGRKINVYDPIVENIEYPTQDPNADIKFHCASSYALGDNEIKVQLDNLDAKIIVKAEEKNVEKIEMLKAPTKTNYNVGEVFNPAGMKIRATYSDSSTKIVPNNELEIIGQNITTEQNDVIISYGKYKTCSYSVNGNNVEYTIKFMNQDNSVLSENMYHYGDKVIAPDDPQKESDKIYKYVFTGWDKRIQKCSQNETYVAQYKKEYINYTVKFVNHDGVVLSENTYHYGDKIIAPANPIRESDKTYKYTFINWGQEVGDCLGDYIFRANYKAESLLGDGEKNENEVVGLTNGQKIGIGVGVGIGVPIMIMLGIIIYYLSKKRYRTNGKR